MNRLSHEKRCGVVRALVEGVSVRGTARLTGVSKQTILTFLLDIGRACVNHEDSAIRGLHCEHVEADEVWGFVHCKDRHAPKAKGGIDHVGSAWTWYAVDRKSKMILSWIMGARDQEHAYALMRDLAGRLCARPQISTDSLGAYPAAVSEAFFGKGVDYGQIHKIYRSTQTEERHYSPSACIGCERRAVRGNPKVDEIGTSRIERANLTLRMSQRRWTRLTNAHSKSFKHMEAAFALHACYYNWCRKHATVGSTPAQAAGLADHQWTISELVGLLESGEQAEIDSGSLKRGRYRRRSGNSN